MEARKTLLILALVFVALLVTLLVILLLLRWARARREPHAPMDPWVRVAYRNRDKTLALVTRDEARLVGAQAVGQRSMDVSGQPHVLAYLRPNQRAFLKRRARGSVTTGLVVDGKRVRAYPATRSPPGVFADYRAGGPTSEAASEPNTGSAPYNVAFMEAPIFLADVTATEEDATRRIVLTYLDDLERLKKTVETKVKWLRLLSDNSSTDDRAQALEDEAQDLEDEFEDHLNDVGLDMDETMKERAKHAIEYAKANAVFALSHNLENTSDLLEREDIVENED